MTLVREQGFMRMPAIEQVRAETFTSQLQREHKISLGTCHSCGTRDSVYDFAVDTATDGVVWAIGRGTQGTVEYCDTSVSANQRGTVALSSFASEFTSVAITSSRCAAATTLSGNLFLCKLPEPATSGVLNWDEYLGGVSATPGPAETSLWNCAPNHNSNSDMLVAVGSSDSPHARARGHAFLVTASRNFDIAAHHHDPQGLRCADWLDPTVCILGSTQGAITLWDSRTHGTSARFNSGRAITGLRGLGNGSQLLAAESGSMKLFDVRMPTTATLKIRSRPSRSEPALYMSTPEAKAPNTAFDVLPSAQLVARRDDENNIGVYSLVTGRRIRSLKTEQSAWVKRIRFLEDAQGTLGLYGCWGSAVEAWTFGGEEDDEGDIWVKGAA